MVRAAALLRRGLIALLACGQAACAFDGGGAVADRPPDPGSVGEPADAGPGGVSPGDAAAALACPDDPDLLACLTFEGAADDGSTHHTPIAVGGTPAFADGIDGLALDAGEGLDVTIGETAVLDPTGELLIDLWARADSLPAPDTRAGLIDNEGQWGFFAHPDGRVSCSMAGVVAADGLLEVGNWVHLTCAYDGAAVRLFKGGALVAEASAGGSLPAAGTDGTAIARNSPNGQYFDGRIDEVRIWRRGAP